MVTSHNGYKEGYFQDFQTNEDCHSLCTKSFFLDAAKSTPGFGLQIEFSTNDLKMSQKEFLHVNGLSGTFEASDFDKPG